MALKNAVYFLVVLDVFCSFAFAAVLGFTAAGLAFAVAAGFAAVFAFAADFDF